MFVYEKDNKLNLTFDKTAIPPDVPDLVISKEDGITKVSIEGEQSSLPPITDEDNGKTLVVQDGQWVLGPAADGGGIEPELGILSIVNHTGKRITVYGVLEEIEIDGIEYLIKTEGKNIYNTTEETGEDCLVPLTLVSMYGEDYRNFGHGILSISVQNPPSNVMLKASASGGLHSVMTTKVYDANGLYTDYALTYRGEEDREDYYYETITLTLE